MIHQQFSRPCFQYSSSASCTLPSSISASPMMPIMRPLGQFGAPALGVHVVLHQAGKARLGDAEADRAGREVDVGLVLGARGIGLRAAEGAEVLQLVERLVAEQVLDGVEHRARVRLDRHAVLRPQDVEIERRHQRDERGGGGLVPAHLQPVAAVHLVVGVMDHVGRQPEHLALELAQHRPASRPPAAAACAHLPSARSSGIAAHLDLEAGGSQPRHRLVQVVAVARLDHHLEQRAPWPAGRRRCAGGRPRRCWRPPRPAGWRPWPACPADPRDRWRAG